MRRGAGEPDARQRRLGRRRSIFRDVANLQGCDAISAISRRRARGAGFGQFSQRHAPAKSLAPCLRRRIARNAGRQALNLRGLQGGMHPGLRRGQSAALPRRVIGTVAAGIVEYYDIVPR
jgi:hypothetical protein